MQGQYRGDFTRDTFDRFKHFTRVLSQQGRVQLDADWNEQASILWHYLHTLAADFIGPHGGPSSDPGFLIAPGEAGDFYIGGGRYYVAGILCEVNSVTYLTQPDYPVPEVEKLKDGTHQVYLDVWERHITYVEDDSIREVALSGPDTAARAKLVWQVKVTDPSATGACATVKELTQRFQPDNRGRLKAKAKEKSASTDPCIIPPDSKYRGAENQLYRVEVHRPGSAWDGKAGTLDSAKKSAATFKWSRENGSVVFPILDLATDSAAGTTTVKLENLGRDDRFGLAEGDWAEIVDDDYVLQNRAEPLLQVHSIDRTAMTVTLNGVPGSNVGKVPAKHPLLRRWDQKQGERTEGGLELASDGAALIVEDGDTNWLNLEDGIQIQFQKADPGPSSQYRTGDYWLIPARTATGDVEWPTIKDAQGKVIQLALAPHGVEHHYAPLAAIAVLSGIVQPEPKDCRVQR